MAGERVSPVVPNRGVTRVGWLKQPVERRSNCHHNHTITLAVQWQQKVITAPVCSSFPGHPVMLLHLGAWPIQPCRLNERCRTCLQAWFSKLGWSPDPIGCTGPVWNFGSKKVVAALIATAPGAAAINSAIHPLLPNFHTCREPHEMDDRPPWAVSWSLLFQLKS